jgi:Glycosyltransferase family 20
MLIQLAVPSRQEVEEYTKLQHEVERLVGHVNGKHSTISYTPVVLLHRSMPFTQLCALFALANERVRVAVFPETQAAKFRPADLHPVHPRATQAASDLSALICWSHVL